jgi:hypothetical protein
VYMGGFVRRSGLATIWCACLAARSFVLSCCEHGHDCMNQRVRSSINSFRVVNLAGSCFVDVSD